LLNNPGTALLPKVKVETRVHDAASGDVSYTGYGYQPSALIIVAKNAGNVGISIGSSEPGLVEKAAFADAGNMTAIDYIVRVPGGADHQRAVVKSYDLDGFTLTWTKGGTGSGTETSLHVFAFK